MTDLIDGGHDIKIISVLKPNQTTIHHDVEKYNLLEKTEYLSPDRSELGFRLTPEMISSLLFTDIMHAHFATEPAECAMKLSSLFNIPFVFTCHAHDIFFAPDIEKLKKQFDLAYKVITISDFNKNYLNDLLGEEYSRKVKVIRCGINLENLIPPARKQNEKCRILFVGRFVEKKGIPYAIRAFHKIAEEIKNVEFRIIGDGKQRPEINYLIGKLGLQAKILLLGTQPHSVVLKEMEQADIFLHPSITLAGGDGEGIPVSIMEAQAMGLPVVSTHHTGIPEVVIHGKTGFLSPEKDIDSLAENLKTLLRNPDLRKEMGVEGRKQIELKNNHHTEMILLSELFKQSLESRVLLSDIHKPYPDEIKKRVRSVGQYLLELSSVNASDERISFQQKIYNYFSRKKKGLLIKKDKDDMYGRK